MKTRQVVSMTIAALVAVTASLVLAAALASAQPSTLEDADPYLAARPLSTQAVSVTFPSGPWPSYAHEALSVHPEPLVAGHPAELCAVVVNHHSSDPHTAILEFGVSDFGIGLPFEPVGAVEVEVPPQGEAMGCVAWVPPGPGHWCIQARLMVDGFDDQIVRRNLDTDEPLQAETPHARSFVVGNHTENPVTITLGLIPHVDVDWTLELSQDTLPDMAPGSEEVVTLTVTPPADLPSGLHPIVDVEAYVEGDPIGGFRKMFRPPILLHRFPDPPYAEHEITVHPYPLNAGEPTEVCVELHNPTDDPHDVTVFFSWAEFGISLPFHPINGPRPVALPPHSIVNECIHWIPPFAGQVCFQVEMEMDGYATQQSRRNLDVDEPLRAETPHAREFIVRNPHEHTVTITLGLIPHLPEWGLELSEDVFFDVPGFGERPVILTVTPPLDLPPDGQPVVDVEAHADGELIGGFRKIFRPPIILHRFPDPPYAEREITIHPDPPRIGEPTEICVELRNPTGVPQPVTVFFSWAEFGIGLPFHPINGPRPVHLPPHSIVNECIHWIPPIEGQVCIQVELEIDGQPPQHSRRNIDVDEPLKPNTPHPRPFPVRNPFGHSVTITLGLIPHFPDWGLELSQDVLPNVPGFGQQVVTLTVTPPEDMPHDGDPIVDVEAYVEGELIGGFRKIYRPPVPIHRPKDPIYAESEIFVHPYPPRAHEPTEVGVEIHNPTDESQLITITFSFARFGIGLPFRPINGPITATVPPHGMIRPSIFWIAEKEGLWCFQVEIGIPGHDRVFYSQRNIDVGEPLEPNTPHSRPFIVHNNSGEFVTITLGLIPHFPDWGLELSQDILLNVPPHGEEIVTLTVTPPNDLPHDGDPIVDVEAFVDGALIGGFRKIFRPPVPVHRPKDPVYAESEIGIDPYPILPGHPVELSVEVFNPTETDRVVTATFSVAPFGIGLPFTTTGITPNPILIFVPAKGAARGHVIWHPPLDWYGKFCVQVTLGIGDHENVWSRRNIDVGEPLEPTVPHSLIFDVGNPSTRTMTTTLGLIPHLPDWGLELSPDTLFNLAPGEVRPVTLIVTPPGGAELGTGRPIVDVEAFVDGELVGGFRKMDIPPIPLHKPHEKGYAESEISITPYPPQKGQPTWISTTVQNTSDVTMTVELEFGWAKFGMGIPFSTTGVVDHVQVVTLTPGTTKTVGTLWTPSQSGHQCVRILLNDPSGRYEPQESQRNVDVAERTFCGTKIFTFTVYNDSPFTATVDIGLITFNVPPNWQVTTEPTDTLTLPPFTSGLVTVIVKIPCPSTPPALRALQAMYTLQEEASGVATIDVEGYVAGNLVGGIELQFEGQVEWPNKVYLPLVLKNR